jgi:hypothetical protein
MGSQSLPKEELKSKNPAEGVYNWFYLIYQENSSFYQKDGKWKHIAGCHSFCARPCNMLCSSQNAHAQTQTLRHSGERHARHP